MAKLQKNIWTLFTVVMLGTMMLLVFFGQYRYQSLEQETTNDHLLQVELFVNSTTALLNGQESLLEVIGQQIIFQNDYTRTASLQIRPLLDTLLELHPAISAFGLANPNGDFIAVSSNLKLSNMPNLLRSKMHREDFIATLESNSIVVGKTYVVPSLEKSVIPIRKALRTKNGDIKAVMTAGLKVQGTMVLRDDSHISNYNSLKLIREDLTTLFISTNQNFEEWLNKPLSEQKYQAGILAISDKYNLTEQEIKQSKRSFTVKTNDGSTKYLSTFHFIPKFNIWVLSQTDMAYINEKFHREVVFFITLFFVIQLSFYLLVRSIANNENKTRERLQYQATHDHLTGLPNQPYEAEYIQNWFNLPKDVFYMFYIDVDNFKSVNEAHGHTFGDKVLIDIAARLKACINPTDILIRKVSDEFIIMIKQCHLKNPEILANEIQTALSRPFLVNGNHFLLGCSIGIAKYPEHGDNLDELLRSADISMYQAKKVRNTYMMFDAEMQKQHLYTMAIEQRLRLAIENDELFMVYQPQFNINGNPYGVEALVRWVDNQLGFIPPNVFIPIAEKSGLMPRLGKLIIEHSLEDISQLDSVYAHNFKLSINISERQFMQADFLQHLLDSLTRTNYSPHNLTLEITENLFIEDLNHVKPICERLHELGIKISIDDFGTGYSSLSMLKALPIDELKVDKSFIDNIHSDNQSLTMVQNIIAIGKIFGMDVLAEGVETDSQRDILKECQCDLLQGYLYSKPIPANDIAQFMTQYSSVEG